MAMQAAAGPVVFPRIALVVAGVVVALTLGGVGIARWSGFDGRQQDAQTVAQRALHFKDQADGGIAIVDAASGATIDTVHGEQGFLRGTLRAVVRERKLLRGSVSNQPLQLISRVDGRLTLLDPATGSRLDLESFGPVNAAVFARWLPQGDKP
jgi:putative photosynthetic complex assembly protein